MAPHVVCSALRNLGAGKTADGSGSWYSMTVRHEFARRAPGRADMTTATRRRHRHSRLVCRVRQTSPARFADDGGRTVRPRCAHHSILLLRPGDRPIPMAGVRPPGRVHGRHRRAADDSGVTADQRHLVHSVRPARRPGRAPPRWPVPPAGSRSFDRARRWSAAVLMASAVGSAITADLGSRTMREETDAMEVMGVSVIRRWSCRASPRR